MSLFSSRRRRRRRSSAAGGTAVSRRRRRRGGILPLVLAGLGVVLVAVLLFSGGKALARRGQEAEIRDLVSELRYACNNLDADALLAAVNPTIADPLRLAAAVTGVNKNQILEELFVSMNADLEGVDLEQVLRSLTCEVRDTQIEGPYALTVVTCTMTVNGQSFTRDAWLYLERIQGSWYVMSAELELSTDW